MATEAPVPPDHAEIPCAEVPWREALRNAPRHWEPWARLWGWDEERIEAAKSAHRSFLFRATRYYLSLADPRDPQDPILRQVLPDSREQSPQPRGFALDAVGDLLPENHPAPGLIQKYPGRALLVVTGACAVHCRYCFRRSFPYGEVAQVGPLLREAHEALAADPSIQEVILSGGDPLILSDEALFELVAGLAAIPHLRRLRVHSRMPVVLPQRITDELVTILSGCRLRCWVVSHFNHARELAPPAVAACHRLQRGGIPVLNQSVLLAGVNDSEEAQMDLQEGLVDAGVKPYYLHQLDRVEGTAHFEVPESEGLNLVERLRKRLTGIALPAYVRDQLGAPSKSPILSLALSALLTGVAFGGLGGCGDGETKSPQTETATATSKPDPSPETAGPTAAEQPAQMPKVVALATKGAVLNGPVDRVLAATLSPGGEPTVFLAQGNLLFFGTWPVGAPAPTIRGHFVGKGRLQTWMAWDLDGDGAQEVIAAFGVGRDFTDAPLEVVRIGRQGKTTSSVSLWRRDGERDQVTALAPWPRSDGTWDLYVAAFSSRFEVDGGVLPRGGGAVQWLPGHRLRMGMARAVGDFDADGAAEVAVGRLYGDAPGADGDLRVIQEDGKYETVPTLRGVRALAAADLEGDGRAELLFGDGWHKAYAKHGRFRPTVARWQPGGAWTSELVEERSDQYSIERIGWFAGHLVASGSQGVYRYRRDGGAWKRSGPLAPTASTGSWSSLGADALLLSGPAARRVPVSQP